MLRTQFSVNYILVNRLGNDKGGQKVCNSISPYLTVHYPISYTWVWKYVGFL